MRRPAGTGAPSTDDDDPLDAWATKLGRRLGLAITIGLMVWLVLYVFGKV